MKLSLILQGLGPIKSRTGCGKGERGWKRGWGTGKRLQKEQSPLHGRGWERSWGRHQPGQGDSWVKDLDSTLKAQEHHSLRR